MDAYYIVVEELIYLLADTSPESFVIAMHSEIYKLNLIQYDSLSFSLGLSLYLALSNEFVLAPITTNQLTGEDNNVCT